MSFCCFLVFYRFDVRCSFVFLLLLCIVCTMGYLYLRGSKADDEQAEMYGYLFITFNTMMGIYIFVSHCIQNEKVGGCAEALLLTSALFASFLCFCWMQRFLPASRYDANTGSTCARTHGYRNACAAPRCLCRRESSVAVAEVAVAWP